MFLYLITKNLNREILTKNFDCDFNLQMPMPSLLISNKK